MNTYSIIAIIIPMFLMVVSFFDTTAWKSKRKYITKYPVYFFMYFFVEYFPHFMNFFEENLFKESIGEDNSSNENEKAKEKYYEKRGIALNLFDIIYAIISGGLLFLFFCSGWIVLFIQSLTV